MTKDELVSDLNDLIGMSSFIRAKLMDLDEDLSEHISNNDIINQLDGMEMEISSTIDTIGE